MIERIKATNPYSGESEMRTPEEHKLYIEIKQAEWDEEYDTEIKVDETRLTDIGQSQKGYI